ncbi:hypothetical protein INR49_010377 [Caranx melampygus]|nr:hypothetical protein INR49_010377 [Caranx melampygus]
MKQPGLEHNTQSRSRSAGPGPSSGPDPLDQGPLQVRTTKLRGPGPGSQSFSSDSVERSAVM